MKFALFLFFLFSILFLSAQEDLKALSLEDLAKRLTSIDTEEVLDTLTEIAERGPSALSIAPQLLAQMNHEEEWVRLAIVETLVKLGPSVIELLSNVFQTQSAQEKALTCRILGELAVEPEKVFPLLKQGLNESSPAVKIAAIHAIWQFQRRAEELIPFLLPLLQTSPLEVQKELLLSLGEINPNRLDVLEALLKYTLSKDKEIQSILGEALSKVSQEASAHLDLLLKALESSHNKYLKAKLLEAIGNVVATQALDKILDYIQDENYLIRYQALKAIHKIHVLTPEQFKKLIPLFQDPYELVRLLWPQVMAELQIQESVPYLIRMLKDINVRVRMAVVRALGQIKPASELQIRGLLKALQDVQMPVVEEAVVSFGNLGSAALPAADTLLRFASVAKGEMLLALLKAHAKIKPPPEKIGPLLEKILAEAEPLYRIWGYYALYETCPEKRNEATLGLIQLLESEPKDLKTQALEAIIGLNPLPEELIEAMIRKYPELQPHEQEMIYQCFVSLKRESRLEPFRSPAKEK